MRPFIIYRLSDGEILRSGFSPDADFTSQATQGTGVIESIVTSATHYVANGQVVAYTPAELTSLAAKPAYPSMWSVPLKQWVDDRSLQQAKDLKWQQIKAARTAAIEAGFLSGGLMYDSDPRSMASINGAVTAAILAQAAGQPFQVTWTLADNSTTVLTGAQLQALGMAAVSHASTQYDRGVARRAAIKAAATIADVDAIVW